jgi:hypothetical protein
VSVVRDAHGCGRVIPVEHRDHALRGFGMFVARRHAQARHDRGFVPMPRYYPA